MECDLSSLQSVEAMAKNFRQQFDTLDILFANAGIMATPPGLTKDGYELQFGTNHMGHALLLKFMLPIMAKTAAAGHDVRIITTASSAFQGASGISYDTIKTPQPAIFGHFRRYMQSKLANLLYAQKIAELYPNIVSCAIQPGAVATDIFGANPSTLDKLFTYISTRGNYLTPEEGSYNMLWVATTSRQNVKRLPKIRRCVMSCGRGLRKSWRDIRSRLSLPTVDIEGVSPRLVTKYC
jgi:NAD(P)-dependent dehydrogenase (short-subunit alcohol dehydrogenase family)